MEASQKVSQQKGAVEGLQNEAEKIGKTIGKSAAEVMEDVAKKLSAGKFASDVENIKIAEDSEFGSYSEYMKESSAVKATQDTGRLSKLMEFAADPEEGLNKLRDNMNLQKGLNDKHSVELQYIFFSLIAK